MNLFITGGHLTPALAAIDEVLKKPDDIALFFVGRVNARTYPPTPSREQDEVMKRGIPFFAINAAKYHRQQWWLNFFELLKFPTSFWQTLVVFRYHRPDMILSFGGYVALPVCLVGKLFGAKVIIHEQTRVAGLANQVIARIADRIALSNTESRKYFDKQKTIVTGNPIRESLLKEYKNPPTWIPTHLRSEKLIYITGGSQGSEMINQTVLQILPELLNNYVVVHQCGLSRSHVYLQEQQAIKSKLAPELAQRYILKEWVEAKDVSYLLRNAYLVIGRSGANTVEEISIAGTPAIFIPLPFAYQNEQWKNADYLVEGGSAIRIAQRDLVPESLLEAIETIVGRYSEFKSNAQKLREGMILDGSKRLVKLVKEYA